MKEIYLAGGCFWGTEHYFKQINGVTQTEVGFANGKTKIPTYEDVCASSSGHAETVKISYDEKIVSLYFLLQMYFDVIDPTSFNKQGGDVGSQYRTGIYFVDESDLAIISPAINELQKKYIKPIAIEVKRLDNYFPATSNHQEYLTKNPGGYCHIGHDKFESAKNAFDESLKYLKKTDEQLKKELTSLQYEVTQHSATERPFSNEFNSHFEDGIYVDIVTGEPLFISTDKFESGCGWPSFSKPISRELVEEITDNTHGMKRTEVRSHCGDSHLGHVFNDGKPELGGLRYCINSASLRFIKKEEMLKQGYGKYLRLLDMK